MKKINFFLLIIIVVLISTFMTLFLIERGRIVQVNRWDMDVTVRADAVMGFNIDNDALHFGSIGRGSGSRREITINDIKQDVIITTIKKGEIATWVNAPNGFIMRKGEERNIFVSLGVPLYAKPGNYTGEILFILKKI